MQKHIFVLKLTAYLFVSFVYAEKSIFHFGIKERLAKLMNPDATVVGDLGDNMKAYYDEEKKVWVFPGEDPAEVAKPIAPPPTTPIQSVPLKPTTTNDPLAAMMAPPPRRGPSQSSLAMRPSPASMPVMFSPKVTTTEPKTVPNIAIFAPQASSSEENKHKIKINR